MIVVLALLSLLALPAEAAEFDAWKWIPGYYRPVPIPLPPPRPAGAEDPLAAPPLPPGPPAGPAREPEERPPAAPRGLGPPAAPRSDVDPVRRPARPLQRPARPLARTRPATPEENDGSWKAPCWMICGHVKGKTRAVLDAEAGYWRVTAGQRAHGVACLKSTCPEMCRVLRC